MTRNVRFIVSILILFCISNSIHANKIVVTSSLDNVTGSLRYSITVALNNDTIIFNNSIDSVYIGTQHILIDKNLTIIGNHNQKTIVFSDLNCRLFSVDAGKTFNIVDLYLKNGYSYQPVSSNLIGGGAIWNRGTTNVTSCIFSNNVAYGEFAPKGGAIYNVGTLSISNSEFKNNKARKSVYSTGGAGGAICNEGGTVSCRFCVFDSNFANATGGAISNNTGKLNMIYCDFFKNTNFDYFQSTGYGGAIYSNGLSICNFDFCNFIENKVYTQATSPSAGGIYSYGGAIYNDATSYMRISRTGFYKNTCGGYNAYKSTVSEGGVIFNKGRCYIDNSSFHGNSVSGQAGFNYSLQVYGNNIYNMDYLKVESSSFFDYLITNELIYNADTLVIYNSITGAKNVGPSYQSDIINTNKIISLGYNLFSRTNTSNYATTGDQFGTVLSPLVAGVDTMDYFGAKTLNLSLKPTSQCINTGDPSISYTDQRNYFRNGIADKGAHEFSGTKNCAFNLNSITVNHNTCFNGTNGSIQLNISGTSSYSLFWDNAMISSNISNLASGVYKFFLYDSLGCSIDSSIQISQPAFISSTLPSLTICNGDSALIFINYKKNAGVYTHTLTAINGCDSVLYQNLVVNTLPAISIIASTNTICAGSTSTLTVSGANTYTWSTNTNANSIVVTPTASGFYIVKGEANNCISKDSVLITVSPLPGVGIIPGKNILCSGDSTNLSASGALTYTWSTSQNTSSISIAPLNTTSYSVSGTDQNGCLNSAQVNMVVFQLPLVNLTTSADTICGGISIILTASGANNYYWSTGVISSSITIAPTITQTYHVIGTDFNNCSNSDTITITVNSTPTISVNSGTICSGESFTVMPSGADTYTYSSGSDIVAPMSDITVTVTGTGINGCVNNTGVASTITVNSSPVISISGNNPICEGSGITITASGADNYLWDNGTPTSTLSSTPTITTIYTVTGTNANNCSSAQTVSIVVDNTCQDVWPGDANSDGVADNLDVLELGLHYTQTGTPRQTISNTWQSYHADNWAGTITNGKNVNHGDCNGDGTINDDDTLSIYNNYGLTHAFKTSQTTTVNPQLSIVPDQPAVVTGSWGSASVYLGDATTNINNINGVAFTVNFDHTLIEPNNIWIEYPTSFINASNQNLHFRKLDFGNDNLYTATTHTITGEVSGNGLIAIVHYQIKSGLTSDQVLNLGIVQANQSSATGSITPLTIGTGSLIAIASSVGLLENPGSYFISISPNPTSGTLMIQSNTELHKIEVMSIEGKVLLSETPTNHSHKLYLDNIPNGIYFVNVYRNNRVVKREKIVLNR